MVKTSTVKIVLMAAGVLMMLGILLSGTGNTSKTIGTLLAIIFIVMVVVVTGPLRRYFEKTKQGTINPNEDGSFQ